MSPDTPRLRPTKDKTGEMDAAWFAEQEQAGVAFEVDENGNKLINTNVAYSDLPPSWQAANIGPAKYVTERVTTDINSGAEVADDEYIESVASDIHENWMRDNEWQKDSNPDLFVPYEDLAETEKAKDRAHVLLTLEVFGIGQ